MLVQVFALKSMDYGCVMRYPLWLHGEFGAHDSQADFL